MVKGYEAKIELIVGINGKDKTEARDNLDRLLKEVIEPKVNKECPLLSTKILGVKDETEEWRA